MKGLFEYNDRLNAPIEAFRCDRESMSLPVEAHWHYYMELIYMVSGSVHISCNEKSFELKPGTMLLIPPQTVHSIYCDEAQDYSYTCIKFNTGRLQMIEDYLPNLSQLFRSILKHAEPPLTFTAGELDDPGLFTIFDTAVEEVKRKDYGYNTLLYSALSGLLIRVIRRWFSMGYSLEPKPHTDAENYSIEDVIRYIDDHAHESISVSELADMCHMSYSYFAKVFREQYGQSCKQYIEFIRLCKAENLILFTDMDLTAIAADTGFSDCSHLIRCFKKNYGTTPKQYRLEHNSVRVSGR